jgi:RNA polymerase sigma-54 factor
METTVQTGVSPSVLPQVVAQSALLELNALELEERVREELEENPALELEDEILDPVEYLPHNEYGGSSSGYSDSYDPWGNLADSWDLRDDIRRELRATADEQIAPVAEYLVESVDEDGYLHGSIEEAAGDLGVSRETASEALDALQGVSADGLGARDLAECIRLQLQNYDPAEIPEGTEALVDNLGFFSGDESVKEMSELTGISKAKIAAALAFIRENLNPYPGRSFQPPWQDPTEDTRYVYPDVVLSITDDHDEVSIHIPQSKRLAMRINAAYRRLDKKLRESGTRAREEGLKQARKMVRQARQFIENISRRHQTMSKVMSAIVAHQKAFILDGPAHLKPLDKKEIAGQVDVHEATVCRATKDKYVLMPDGSLEPIDIFFDDALPAKNMISRLISTEDPIAPFSDSALQRELEDRGFDLARRTVTKYRLQMEIPSANDRRRKKAA